MKKNLFYLVIFLALAMIGCRNDYFNINESYSNQQGFKFRIVPKSEIPEIINELKTKTNNFKVPLKHRSSTMGKTETLFGDINTSYIVETTNDISSDIYYTFSITSYQEYASETYNLEIRTDNMNTPDIKVIVYEPTTEWQIKGNNDYLTFSGNKSIYSIDGDLENMVTYAAGNPDCPPPPEPCPDCPTTPNGPGGGTGGNGGGIPGGGAGGGGGGGGGIPGGDDPGGDTSGTGSSGGSSLCPACVQRDQDTGACTQWVMVTCTGSLTGKLIKNCPKIGSGSGGVVIFDPTKTPCAKTKTLLDNTNMQTFINNLKNNAITGTGEQGFKATKTGTPSSIIQGGAHSVNFGDKTGYAGGYHNHTKTGIPMLSPGDIDQLLGFARAQGNYGDPTQAFVGMVAPNGMHYIIRFEGTYQDATSFNFMQTDIDNLGDIMTVRNSIFKSSTSSDSIEKLFFKTLNDMGLDKKIILQRVENDGTIKTINKNNDGTITPVPCS